MSQALMSWNAKVAEAFAYAQEGKLRRASATLRELAEACSVEAEKADGLLSDSAGNVINPASLPASMGGPVAKGDMTSCARGAHAYGPLDANGWATCEVCGQVNLNPKV